MAYFTEGLFMGDWFGPTIFSRIRDKFSTGQALYLFDKLANGGGELSAVSFGLQAADFSIGRVPSGSTNWVLCLETIGFANNAVVIGDPANLKVNEWMANPSIGDDWFEIYNRADFPVDMAGLYLTDDVTLAGQTKFKVAPLSFIAARGWVKWEADEDAPAGRNHVNFDLDGDGERIRRGPEQVQERPHAPAAGR